MKIEKGKLPTDQQLMSGEMSGGFAVGFGAGEDIPLIPREEWQKEIEKMKIEETSWWKGNSSDAELIVELPFWLMVPASDFEVSHEETKLIASVRNDYLALYHGPTFLSSHANAAFVGSKESLDAIDFDTVVPNKMPITRFMKTVIVFNTKAIEDAFAVWNERKSIKPSDRTQVRRMNRALQYFDSLAFAHIPFLNKVITAYRSVSFDPAAFEVSEWDVPVWYAKQGQHIARIGLMPYWDSDEFPSFKSQSKTTPFIAATTDQVKSQLEASVSAGKMELLDSLSLAYRGRFGDAVRSIVTAIEVALEAQLKSLMEKKGLSEQKIEARLAATQNSFFERITEYETLSEKRLPGPILSSIPYINGVRLKSELEWVRRLRHKVVHEGTRIDIFSRGTMLRAIETMSWLYSWISWEDDYSSSTNRNRSFFAMLRGMRRYPFEYTKNGVEVRSYENQDAPEKTPFQDELLKSQYDAAIGVEHHDIELFVRMTFELLKFDLAEGPPQQTQLLLQPRFIVEYNSRKAITFCIELGGLFEIEQANLIIRSVLAYRQQHGNDATAICFIQHQCNIDPELRELESAITAESEMLMRNCGIAIITTVDLHRLINGMAAYQWPKEEVIELFFTPGRQTIAPPFYQKIGSINQLYPKASALSIHLDAQMTIKVGDTLGLRLATQYFEQLVDSLQVNKTGVADAAGPCLVGIRTTLTKQPIKQGASVYIKKIHEGQQPMTTPTSKDEVQSQSSQGHEQGQLSAHPTVTEVEAPNHK